jgi:translation initiation factor IF-3
LIGPEGEQVGIVPTSEALARAREAGLDLVEVSPTSRPPVCRILDYGKYKYDQAKKQAQSRKKQHVVTVKGMRFRPKIEEHDYQFKMRHVRAFLEEGNKVKCFVLFRGREKAHTEFGSKIMERLAADLLDIATVESTSRLEGNSMTMLLNPRPGGPKKPATVRPKPEKKAAEASSAPPQTEPESLPEPESEMKPQDEA